MFKILIPGILFAATATGAVGIECGFDKPMTTTEKAQLQEISTNECPADYVGFDRFSKDFKCIRFSEGHLHVMRTIPSKG